MGARSAFTSASGAAFALLAVLADTAFLADAETGFADLAGWAVPAVLVDGAFLLAAGADADAAAAAAVSGLDA